MTKKRSFGLDPAQGKKTTTNDAESLAKHALSELTPSRLREPLTRADLIAGLRALKDRGWTDRRILEAVGRRQDILKMLDALRESPPARRT